MIRRIVCARRRAECRCHADGIGGVAGFRASRGTASQDRCRRHCLDDFGDRPGADDEHPGPGAVLLRHGAQEERARHHGADAGRGRARLDSLDGDRLQPRLHRRQPGDRHIRPRPAARHGHECDQPARQDHPGIGVHALPDDVRGHHRGAGCRLGRRSHALLGLSVVRRRLAAAGLCADRALGVGRRLPRHRGRAGFRRRPGRASERRHRRAGRLLSAGRAARLRHRQSGAI